MKLGIMQPYFFPYIGYWQLMNAVDLYVVYDDVNYIKGGWINRNRILVNGQANFINLPLIDASPNKHINNIEVNNNELLIKKNINKLEMSYRKAPYFNVVFPVLEDILLCNEKSLPKYILYSFEKIAEYLGITTKFVLSSTIEKDIELKGKDKVINICSILNADEYYNAIGGKELYDKEEFKNNGIKLSFLETDRIEYKQFNNEFVSNLSIIDIMMFNSKEDIRKMLKMYKAI